MNSKRIKLNVASGDKIFIIVDEEDVERVKKKRWWLMKNQSTRSLATKYNGKYTYISQFLFKGDNPKKERIVKKNYKPFDYRKENLILESERMTLTSEKYAAKQKEKHDEFLTRKHSRYRGVSPDKRNGNWEAYIYIKTEKGKNPYKKSISTFKTEIEAAIAYNEANRKYNGKNAYQNIIPKG